MELSENMPKLFSEREGIKTTRKELQIRNMSKDLRVRLWNAFQQYYWEYIKHAVWPSLDPLWLDNVGITKDFLYRLWDGYFKRPISELNGGMNKAVPKVGALLKKYFFICEWYEVYDFLEFVVNNWPDPEMNKKFMEYCNHVLKEENAGYRFVNGMIVPIFEEGEISEIETAFDNVMPWKGVYDDLHSALKHLSDREHPKYKDSVAASIRAVEGVAKLIAHRQGTLGELMPRVQEALGLDEHFAKAIGQLWKYANAVARHSDPEGEKMPEFEEAKFILVTSSAVINYLIAKANKEGVELKLE